MQHFLMSMTRVVCAVVVVVVVDEGASIEMRIPNFA